MLKIQSSTICRSIVIFIAVFLLVISLTPGRASAQTCVSQSFNCSDGDKYCSCSNTYESCCGFSAGTKPAAEKSAAPREAKLTGTCKKFSPEITSGHFCRLYKGPGHDEIGRLDEGTEIELLDNGVKHGSNRLGTFIKIRVLPASNMKGMTGWVELAPTSFRDQYDKTHRTIVAQRTQAAVKAVSDQAKPEIRGSAGSNAPSIGSGIRTPSSPASPKGKVPDEFAGLPHIPESLKPVYLRIKGNDFRRRVFIATRQYIQDCKSADVPDKPKKPRKFDWDYTLEEEDSVVSDCVVKYYDQHPIGSVPETPKEPFEMEPLSEESKAALETLFEKIKDDEKKRLSFIATREYLEACRADIKNPPEKPSNFNWDYTVEGETAIVEEALIHYYVNTH